MKNTHSNQRSCDIRRSKSINWNLRTSEIARDSTIACKGYNSILNTVSAGRLIVGILVDDELKPLIVAYNRSINDEYSWSERTKIAKILIDAVTRLDRNNAG